MAGATRMVFLVQRAAQPVTHPLGLGSWLPAGMGTRRGVVGHQSHDLRQGPVEGVDGVAGPMAYTETMKGGTMKAGTMKGGTMKGGTMEGGTLKAWLAPSVAIIIRARGGGR